MFRFLIYILALCLLNISCSHFEKKVVAIDDPISPKPEWAPPELSTIAYRGISAEAFSVEASLRAIKTADELDALIGQIKENYNAVPDTEKLLALELMLLKPFRGYNTTFNQISIGMQGTDFLSLISGLETKYWKQNNVINSYLNDKKVRRVTSRENLQVHLVKEFVPLLHFAFRGINQLTSASYKTGFCLFSCDSKKAVAPLVALKTLALTISKLGFQFAYKYDDIFTLRQSSAKAPKAAGDDASNADPNLISSKYTEFELRSKMKEFLYLLTVSIKSKEWLQYTYQWYKTYISLVIRLDSTKAPLQQAFMGNHQIIFQKKPVLINLAAFFDSPNPDLKNFLAHVFDDRTKTPTAWDLDSYKAIFPNLRSNDEVPFHINALIDYFPGGLPFPLKIVFNPVTSAKAKK